MPISAPTTTVITAPWNGSAFAETVSYDAGSAQVITVIVIGPAFNIQAITYGGQALTRRIVQSDDNTHSAAIWDIDNPLSGVNDLILTSDRATSVDCAIYSLTGLDASNLRGETLFNTGGAISATSLSFTNALGAIIVDGLVTSNTVTSTVGPLPQTVGLNGGTARAGALTYTSHEISEEAAPSVSWVMSGSNRALQVAISYNAAPAPAQSITSVDGDNTVTDGQQTVPVVVTGFTGDVTSASLRVGANTIPLTGLAGTGDNYTVNFPDVAAFTVDTAGLPFSSGAYQNEVVVTDGTDTAAINITREPKAGYTVVETISATAVKGSIFESRVGGAPFDGSQIYYSTAGNTTISATGIITTDLTTLTAHVWDVTSGNWELMTFNGINIGGFFPSITNTVTKVNAAVFIPKIYRGSN
jgi:hypothetical protein